MSVKTKLIPHITESEIRFVDHLGGYSNIFMPRKELLRGYISGAKKRTDWGLVDGAKVIAHAESCLARLGV